MIPLDLEGQIFGRWRVINRAENSRTGKSRWFCECSCGTKRIVFGGHLVSGNSVSCGCYSREITAERNKTHGKADSRLYSIWLGMRDRCYRKTNHKYSEYGARGIGVCADWRSSYVSFEEWAISNGYIDGLSIDRINNDGNYSPDNCRWTTAITQANNKRNNHIVDYGGEKITVSQLSKISGVSYNTLLSRINRDGMSAEEAAVTPVVSHSVKMKTDQAYRDKVTASYRKNRPNKKAVAMLDKDRGIHISTFEKLMDAASWIRENTKYIKADYSTIRKAANNNGCAYGYRWRLQGG